MEFEWDEDKNVENIRIHDGVSFEDAISAFYDEWNIEDFDASHSDSEEQRFTIIGLAGFQLLRVTFTIRKSDSGEEVIRIITARKAKHYEKNDYEEARNRFDI